MRPFMIIGKASPLAVTLVLFLVPNQGSAALVEDLSGPRPTRVEPPSVRLAWAGVLLGGAARGAAAGAVARGAVGAGVAAGAGTMMSRRAMAAPRAVPYGTYNYRPYYYQPRYQPSFAPTINVRPSHGGGYGNSSYDGVPRNYYNEGYSSGYGSSYSNGYGSNYNGNYGDDEDDDDYGAYGYSAGYGYGYAQPTYYQPQRQCWTTGYQVIPVHGGRIIRRFYRCGYY